ncbi:MAG TPA: 6-carboxytetrahydropterin synthase QueD [Clostridia bacterium]|nr:6-carboxytetrahydropterin synthase QueD [Clostridia bacterium]
MSVLITKQFTFNSAHYLPNHPGHCKNLHGHTYKLELTIKGHTNAQTGMVMDFEDLKQTVKKYAVDKLDHRLLNEVLPDIPTAENIALWICRSLQEELPEVYRVKLWETPTCYVEVYATDV